MTYILLLSVDSPRSPNSPRSSTKNIKEYFNYLPSNLKVSKSTRVNSAQKSHCWGFLFDILLFWWILCVLFFPSAPFEFLFPYILTKKNFCFNNFVNLNLFLWITKEKCKDETYTLGSWMFTCIIILSMFAIYLTDWTKLLKEIKSMLYDSEYDQEV